MSIVLLILYDEWVKTYCTAVRVLHFIVFSLFVASVECEQPQAVLWISYKESVEMNELAVEMLWLIESLAKYCHLIRMCVIVQNFWRFSASVAFITWKIATEYMMYVTI